MKPMLKRSCALLLVLLFLFCSIVYLTAFGFVE